jgi:hypothetical protein
MSGRPRAYLIFYLLVGLAACGRTPLEDQVPASPSKASSGPFSNGSIKVTLYNNGLANGAGQVDLLLPDGSKLSQGATPSCLFSHLSQAGLYTARLQNQSSTAPVGVTVTLSVLSPTAALSLQLGGSSLLVTPAQVQAVGFAYDPTTFYYTVTANQAAGNAQDLLLDIDPATLPPGWTYSFANPVLRGSASTTLALSSGLGCTSTAVTAVVRAQPSIPPLAAAVTVNRAWSLGFSSTWVQSTDFTGTSKGSPSADRNEVFLVSAQASGLATGAELLLTCLDCPTHLCMDLNGIQGFVDQANDGNYPTSVGLPANGAPMPLVVHLNHGYVPAFQFQLTLGNCVWPEQMANH